MFKIESVILIAIVVLINCSVTIIQSESKTRHPFYPLLRVIYQPDEKLVLICEEQNLLEDFPNDLFTGKIIHSEVKIYVKDYYFPDQQKQNGAVSLHIFGALYFFTVTAVIVNDYFIPSVQCICDDLKLSPVIIS